MVDQAKENTLPPIDDIPEAQREGVSSQTDRAQTWKRWLGLLAVAALGVSAIAATVAGSRGANGSFQPMTGVMEDSGTALENGLAETPSPADRISSAHRTLLGHRAYEEAPASDLKSLTADGSIKLRTAAADSFQAMVQAAAADGVQLVPLSGYRSIEDQEYLFFQISADRSQTVSRRAEVSAPPGYSEHHTGYAIDIGDPNKPATHLLPEFAETEAYAWLEDNAARYSFELSFEGKEEDTVVFEPWHWRFVGDRESLETFYQEVEE